jgi:hypothetical protein
VRTSIAAEKQWLVGDVLALQGVAVLVVVRHFARMHRLQTVVAGMLRIWGSNAYIQGRKANAKRAC